MSRAFSLACGIILGQVLVEMSRRLSFRARQDQRLLDDAWRACVLAGVAPRFFLRMVITLAMGNAAIMAELRRLQMEHDARRRRERLGKRTVYRHRHVL